MSPTSNISTDFRSDINGLRAWAVITVILFHFGIPGFNGGFVGVDIFFVISGYLMTGIVISGLERGKFSILSFYLARARRIVPALIGICGVLLIAGWWILMPVDYKTLATQIIFSLAFLSNVKFWREAGYFDTASHEKWLLHTWSLAVEWQFYIFLPLALIVIWRLWPSRKALGSSLIIGAAFSFALSLATTPSHPSAAFFLLPTRAWEMLAGGLVYLYGNRTNLSKNSYRALELVGFVLIIASVCSFKATTLWPGWRASIPVIGTALILISAQTASNWTGTRAAQWLGSRSYSLYLWHWPISVALVYFQLEENTVAIVAGLALTLLTGNISFHLIENMSRKWLTSLTTRAATLTIVTAALVICAPSLIVRAQNGISGRFSPEIEMVASEALDQNPRKLECNIGEGVSSPSCKFGGPKLRAIVVGDSHANALVSGVAAAAVARNPENGVMEWSYSACPTVFGTKPSPSRKTSSQYKCAEFLDWAKTQLSSVPVDIPLVIISRSSNYIFGFSEPWEADANTNAPLVYFDKPHKIADAEFIKQYSENFKASTCELARARTVYMTRPVPEMNVDVPKSARAMIWGPRKETSIPLSDYYKRHDLIWKLQDEVRDLCGVKILDTTKYLCPEGRCRDSKKGRPIYYDDDHLSEFGNKLLTPMFSQIFEAQQ